MQNYKRNDTNSQSCLEMKSGENMLVLKCNYASSVEITNKMQPCNRIYYSSVHWRLNMFRAAYLSSSGAL